MIRCTHCQRPWPHTRPERRACPWHEFRERSDDLSMCRCGVPALIHEQVYPIDGPATYGVMSARSVADLSKPGEQERNQ